MHKFRTTVAAATILAMAGCNTHPDIKTETVVDAKTNLAGYKSFSWLGSLSALRDPNRQWTPAGFDVHKEIKFLVEEQLRARGMTYAAGQPDAYVTSMLLVDTDANAEAIEELFGKDADTTNLEAGALVVAFVDASTRQAVWAGAAVAQAKPERTDAEAKERLAAAIQKLFHDFPK